MVPFETCFHIVEYKLKNTQTENPICSNGMYATMNYPPPLTGNNFEKVNAQSCIAAEGQALSVFWK